MTLVEIILAMAILSLVIILMTPVLVSGFNMITLSGNRHINAKSVAGEVENNLAGETVTASLHDISIQLPGDIVVDGKSYTLSQGNGARQVDLNGYIIDSIPFFDPIGNAEESLPVTVDVSGWRSDAPYGVLQKTTSAMEYRIYRVGSPPPQNSWITCSELQTRIWIEEVPISNNAQDKGYQVDVQLIGDDTSRKKLDIRQAPPVFFNSKNKQTVFYIYNPDLTSRDVRVEDKIELFRPQQKLWESIESSKQKFKDLDTENIYVRYAASSSLAPSLPRHVKSG